MKIRISVFFMIITTSLFGVSNSMAPIVSYLLSDSEPVKVVTQTPLIIIQVEYNDYQFTSSASTWNAKIFGEQDGQLNDYFMEVSREQFKVSPATESYGTENDGIITVSINANHPGNDKPVNKEHFIQALEFADPYIDYASYDTDSDGYIRDSELQVMFLVAGGEAATGLNPGVWAHAWCMSPTASTTVTDGVYVAHCSYDGDGQYAGYSCFGEHHFDHSQDASIGIIAHELGHATLGLPDLYDTDLSSEGIGYFGLMGAGSWGYKSGETSGETPSHMSAWSKIKKGWVDVQEITTSQTNVSLLDTNNLEFKPLKIETGNPGEYFLIENRSANGYDRGLYRLDYSTFLGGIAIWHIDDSQTSNSDETHKWVDLEEANGISLDVSGNRGDQINLFYSGNKIDFTTTSDPNTNRYDSASTGINITNISSLGSTMTLDIAK